ncbi:glycosyltransferase family 4 protein [Spiribacter pallidus]|uniref:glycosyltransferase family 4 protein n=1 Tax=Spiribacter pallidus TaxID=1987936 RepID=UPI00349FDBBB
MSWQASLVTYADLGESGNLKTKAVRPLVIALRKEKRLKQVLYRFGKEEFADERAIFGSCSALVIKLVKVILPSKFSRLFEEQVLDWLAAFKLRAVPEILIVHPIRFRRALKKAGNSACLKMIVATTAHPAFNNDLIEVETGKVPFSLVERWKYKIELDSIYEADHIIAVSEFVKDTYVRYGVSPERISVASLNVDDRFYMPEEHVSASALRVFYPAASSGLLRGTKYLVEAWSKLEVPGKMLLMAGGGIDQRTRYGRELSARIAGCSGIVKVGVLDDKQMRAQYNAADIVVLPSLSEGCPKTVLEAMCCGAAVITTENARGPIVHGVSGFVVPIGDCGALKDAIELLAGDPALRRMLGSNARRRIESLDGFGHAVVCICGELLSARGE